jgi:hypothetical protein
VAQHFVHGKANIVGSPNNELAPIHPLYNVGLEAALNALQYFQQLHVPQTQPS